MVCSLLGFSARIRGANRRSNGKRTAAPALRADAGRAISPGMRGSVFPALAAALPALSAGPVAAHPHIFIDAGLVLHVDAGGRLEAVEVRWTYDPFYSLLILADRGLDPDGDGRLTPEEQASLRGFDLAVDEGYTGALEVLAGGGVPEALGAPRDPQARLVDGQIVSSHLWPLADPPTGRITVRSYDPGYYAAISLTNGAILDGDGASGCSLSYAPADLAAATAELEEMLYGPDAKTYGEDDFPAVGAAFADAVIVSCAPEG